MARKLVIRAPKQPSLTVNRSAVKYKKVVYLICARKPVRYRWLKSRILYIGQTRNGLNRVAESAARKASEAFGRVHGVKDIDAEIVSCKGRQRVATWSLLERDLILKFRTMHGEIPRMNKQGKRFKVEDYSGLFKVQTLERLLDRYGASRR